MTARAKLSLCIAVVAVCAGSLWIVAAAPPAARVSVCTSVEDREPVGVASRFPASVGEVWCFSEVNGVEGTITHVWYYQDKEVRRMSLAVKGSRWRTWSAKTIPAAWTGPWRVSVLDPRGKEIGSVSFTIDAP